MKQFYTLVFDLWGEEKNKLLGFFCARKAQLNFQKANISEETEKILNLFRQFISSNEVSQHISDIDKFKESANMALSLILEEHSISCKNSIESEIALIDEKLNKISKSS